MSKNSVLEELRVRRLAAYYLACTKLKQITHFPHRRGTLDFPQYFWTPPLNKSYFLMTHFPICTTRKPSPAAPPTHNHTVPLQND